MSDDATIERGRSPDAPAVTPGELITSTQREGDVHTLCLFGELDLANVRLAQEALERIEATGPQAVIIDLSGLTFMDSTGIQMIVRAHARAYRNAHRLMLRRGPAAVQRIVTLCGVDELLTFTD